MLHMTMAACYILHYGREYLGWSLRSIRDFCDEIYVFYTPTPSHGQVTELKNPETREELYDIAKPYDVHWIDCNEHFEHEGKHRTFAVDTIANDGHDLVMVVDADEIWDPSVLQIALNTVQDRPERNYVINAMHFWRGTKWICYDQAMPTRFIKPNVLDNTVFYLPNRFYHFGYAQSSAIVRYKMSIHGHKSELRKDWYNNIFLPWKPGMTDVHPTCDNNFWSPVPYVDDDGTLEYLLGDHPYFNMEIIP